MSETQNLEATPRSADAASILARVSAQMAALEKRDSELWVIVVLTSSLVAAGLLVTIAPATFFSGGFHIDVVVPKEVFVSLVVLIALVNIYLISQRVELRRTRQMLISSSIQGELTRLQSFTDPLTEIYNRRSLSELLSRYISYARRMKKPLSFLMVDIDRFKQVNTRFGHLTGDMVIAEMASLLKNSVRGSDAVIRFGGDEFFVILADADQDGSQRVIDRIHRFLEEWNAQGHLADFELTLSVGLSEWAEAKSVEDLLNEADTAMYSKKFADKAPVSV